MVAFLGGQTMTTTDHQPAIRCQSLYKVFGLDAGALDQAYLDANGLVAAVSDVTIGVFPGEILVVMGLSGSGKSTLVRCLSRLIEATSGRVEIEGRDLLAMSELVSLAGKENSFPRELSGGQQQRVGIARSLAAEPDIWFLDEPFSALDPLIRREMQDEFLRLQALLHKTIIFITRDFDEALRLAARIAIIPSVRYTIEGLRNVPPELHEAFTMAGCNKRQRLIQLELPVALPYIMLGINQTTMFAFSMVIIAAFIGTIDLGQAIFKALSESNLGKGLTLGLCVSFLALSADHLITRWARERRLLLGLD